MKPPISAPDESDALDATFFALSSGLRRRMLDALKRTPGINLGQLCAHIGADIGRFAVMKHLAALERGGLVISQRDGRERRLWFDPTPIQLIHERWTSEFSVIWASRLTRLKYDAEGAEVLPLMASNVLASNVLPPKKKEGRRA
ncbi:MAG: ArsR/SmtB family transcription factor [Pseudomarimonas sp.]